MVLRLLFLFQSVLTGVYLVVYLYHSISIRCYLMVKYLFLLDVYRCKLVEGYQLVVVVVHPSEHTFQYTSIELPPSLFA